MEIKIVEQNGTKYAGIRTVILEGTEITHESIYFHNREAFLEIYNKQTNALNGHVIGIPDYFWNEDPKKPDQKVGNEYFHLFFYYNLKGEFEYIVVKNAIIYITTNGQTIDKITV